MAKSKTVYIPKYKFLNFRKLSFLYLIFIVFFFFSTSGDYLKHYRNLEKTQHQFNENLLKQLNQGELSGKNLELKMLALSAIQKIDSLAANANTYLKKRSSGEDALKSTSFIQTYPNHRAMNQSLEAFSFFFTGKEAIRIRNLLGVENLEEDEVNSYLKNAPNASISSIGEHLKTVVLQESLRALDQNRAGSIFVKSAYLRDSLLLSGLKNHYEIGNKVELKVYSGDNKQPVLLINSDTLSLSSTKTNWFSGIWIPQKSGEYLFRVVLDEEEIEHWVKVSQPSPYFLESKQELACLVNEPLPVYYNNSGYQQNQIQFRSTAAKLEKRKNELVITPITEGRFSVKMYLGNELIDERYFYAKEGRKQDVFLRDIAGASCGVDKAHCLESKSSDWQVVNFQFIVIDPEGNTRKIRSMTRFLRNEIRVAEQTALKGSTILFDQIRLIHADGGKTEYGNPLYFIK